MSAESVQPRAVPTGIKLMPDSSRVVARLFVPGLEDVGPTGSRASAVIGRLLSLDEKDCVDALEDVLDRSSTRHSDLEELFDRNAERVLTLIDPVMEISAVRRSLIGAERRSSHGRSSTTTSPFPTCSPR